MASATRRHLLFEQLLASAGDGVWIQAEEFGQHTVATVPQFDRFHARRIGAVAARPANCRTAQWRPGVPGEKPEERRHRRAEERRARFVECASDSVPAADRPKYRESVRPLPSGVNVRRGPDRGEDLGPQHGVSQRVRRRSSHVATDGQRTRW